MLDRKLTFACKIWLLSFAFLSGCTTVQLVSDYDEKTDKDAATLHKKFETYFASLQTVANDKKMFKNQQSFYEEVLVDLNSLMVRASAIYKNELTEEQLEIIEENLAYLVLLHKNCVQGPLTKEQKDRVKEKGVDISMDCRIDYGATSNLPNRGDMKLTVFLVPPIQAMFNQKFGAVMALELAKKRGEAD